MEYRLCGVGNNTLFSSLGDIRSGKGIFDNRGSRRRFDYTFDSMAAFIATNRIRARWFFDSNSHGPWEYWNHNVPAMNIIRVLRQYNPKSIGRRRINLAPSALSLMFGGRVEGRESHRVRSRWFGIPSFSRSNLPLPFRFVWMDTKFYLFFNRPLIEMGKIIIREGLINRSDRSEWIWKEMIKKF